MTDAMRGFATVLRDVTDCIDICYDESLCFKCCIKKLNTITYIKWNNDARTADRAGNRMFCKNEDENGCSTRRFSKSNVGYFYSKTFLF